MSGDLLLRLMEEILHQLIGTLFHYLQGYVHPGGAGFPPSTVCKLMVFFYMGVSENRGKTPPKSSILIGFSIIFTIHFGVALFLETPIYLDLQRGANQTLRDGELITL